jgi:hypothetical protein
MNQNYNRVRSDDGDHLASSDKFLKDAIGGTKPLTDKTKALEFKTRRGTLFNVEMGVDGEDLIFHFYMPVTSDAEAFFQKLGAKTERERTLLVRSYWDELFPASLDATAQSYFKAEAPRLEAQHISDPNMTTQFDGRECQLDSWWLRARSFANNTLDLDLFVERFYLALESSLLSKKRM